MTAGKHVWYDLLFRPPENEPIRRALVAKSDLSPDVKQLLNSLLAPHPADRPSSAAEVKEWLTLLLGEE